VLVTTPALQRTASRVEDARERAYGAALRPGNTVIPGRALGADPESRGSALFFGFRVRSRFARPGKTVEAGAPE
jgi:hypothetical protein